ncbi:uncharacterized protein LOC115826065 [Chanos chanos]|uniref:Uncharacterized protein LOC115826065 n=1 Tax=Chanos chanos TaxID=29144 RepID=A0A6J2WQ61_CHACN|nr:uncharacterized protein LOC115826065 [Chanos chanos]
MARRNGSMFWGPACFFVVLPLNYFASTLSYMSKTVDLQCLIDYETDMDCDMTSDKAINCAELRLEVMDSSFRCNFKAADINATFKCQCKVNAFFSGETYAVHLLNGGKVEHTKVFNSTGIIKPKAPTILSVNKTKHGNFIVTWKHNYDMRANFPHTLVTHLSYRIKGDTQTYTREVDSRSFEIVGEHLQPNTNYVVTVRCISPEYGSRFSDFSDEHEFTTPASPPRAYEFLIVVVLCAILMIVISISFYYYGKVKKQWWDKLPKPSKIDLIPDEHKFSIMHPMQTDTSSVQVEIPKLDIEEKHWAPSLADDSTGNSNQTVNTGSTSVDYPNVFPVCQEQNNMQDMVEKAVSEILSQFNPSLQISHVVHNNDSYNVCGNLESSDGYRLDNQGDSGNGSGSSFYNNKTYEESSQNGSSFLRPKVIRCDSAYHSSGSEMSIPVLFGKCTPLIPTDFDYGPVSSCSVSASPPVGLEIESLDAGYQSFSEVTRKENSAEMQCLSLPREPINFTALSQFCKDKMALYKNAPCTKLPVLTSGIEPCDNEYQAL